MKSKIEKIWKEYNPNQKQLPIICLNCKEIYNNPIEQCNCGGKSFQNTHPSNAKKFIKFNPELFLAYINKFSEEDKVRAFDILTDACKKWDGINNAAPFYMHICRAYNAGKRDLRGQIHESKEFVSSDEYFRKEFGF